MKINIQNRIFPLLLVVLLFPVFMAVPARADEIYDGNFYNVLDLATVNNSGRNFFDLDGSATVVFSLDRLQVVSSVDLIVYSTAPLSSASIVHDSGTVFNLDIYPIDEHHYRLYGNLQNFGFSSFSLSLQTVGNVFAYAEVMKFVASPMSFVTENIYASGYAWAGSLKTEFDNVTYGYITAQSPDLDCQITVVPLEWKQFDFLTLYIKHDAYSINSISADLNYLPIPYEVDYIESSVQENEFRYAITLDLRGLDRSGDFYPNIRIRCRLPHNDEAVFDIINCVGYVTVDPSDPLGYWFRSLGTSLQNWFSDLSSSVELGAYYTQQWLQNIYNETVSGFAGIGSSIDTWGQAIVDAIAPDVDTSDMENSVADAKQDLDDAQQAMDDFTLPSVDSVVPDVSGELETGEGSNFSYIMEVFFANPLIFRMVTVGVGFMLFGIIMG